MYYRRLFLSCFESQFWKDVLGAKAPVRIALGHPPSNLEVNSPLKSPADL